MNILKGVKELYATTEIKDRSERKQAIKVAFEEMNTAQYIVATLSFIILWLILMAIENWEKY